MNYAWKRNIVGALVPILLLLLLVTACGAPPPSDPVLVGSTWLVSAYQNDDGELVSVIPPSITTAQFREGGELLGTAVCGLYSAAYQSDDTALTIGSIEVVPTGEQSCPENAIKQDRMLLTALTLAATYEISGQIMVIYGADGNPVANLKHKPVE
ncbi:MAG: META domain-containing protein, partial [Chloroflexota bacterium]|nr:META domain-containing protein [Chloroflexota bacterium]